MSTQTTPAPPPWSRDGTELCLDLGVDSALGLSTEERHVRLDKFGANALRRVRAKSGWKILFAQCSNLLTLLLLAAATVSLVFGEWVEATAIGAVLVINAAIGFFTEMRAVRSMEALTKLGRSVAKVLVGGEIREIDAEGLVPGDIVLLEGGDVVTADCRVLSASRLQADESTFTGESAPVGKNSEGLPEDLPIAERRSMLFKGTALTRGDARCVVVATGQETELGAISKLVEEAQEEQTPLERRLGRLGQGLVWVTLAIAIAIALVGWLAGKPPLLIVETAIALAVASVPEGLPILATMTLARGMHRMAHNNALVQRLSAVETLGTTSMIFSDKTGTLTENRMTVYSLSSADGVLQQDDKRTQAALQVGVLCNRASISGERGVGDPLEIALLKAGQETGIERGAQVAAMPECHEEAFDPDIKMMATVHQVPDAGEFVYAVKGAPEAVLACCTFALGEEGTQKGLSEQDRLKWLAQADKLAAEGLRVLALASKRSTTATEAIYDGLTVLALVGVIDPPRQDVKQAIRQCRDAGIEVAMVTGDHPATARNIALQVGIVDDSNAPVMDGMSLQKLTETAQTSAELEDTHIFARVSPSQKLALIAHHQREGRIVAMTGDGVNDAPALKKADIGVAMGERGTDVAREAADMVLQDDHFTTIARAVYEGRVIFRNIRSFVVYLLSCNLSEILVVGLATVVNAPLPLLPLQILFLNLVTDVFPALALAASEGSPQTMKMRPRDPVQAIIGRRQWQRIFGYGLLITAAVLAAFAIALGPLALPVNEAVTVSFLTLALAQLFHVFNMRESGSSWFSNEIVQNRMVWYALVLCLLLLAAAIYWQSAAQVLSLQSLGLRPLLLAGVASIVPLLVGHLLRPPQRAPETKR